MGERPPNLSRWSGISRKHRKMTRPRSKWSKEKDKQPKKKTKTRRIPGGERLGGRRMVVNGESVRAFWEEQATPKRGVVFRGGGREKSNFENSP